MILTIVIALSILINVKAFAKCVAYKLQYKELCIFMYFPFLGQLFYFIIGKIFYNDAFYIYRKLSNKYPKAKFIAANMLFESSVWIIDPKAIKDFS